MRRVALPVIATMFMFLSPATAGTVTTYDGKIEYSNCGQLPPSTSYVPCTYTDPLGGTASAQASVDVPSARVSVRTTAAGTLPVGHSVPYTLSGVNAFHPTAWARVTKKIAVSGPGDVVVQFTGITGRAEATGGLGLMVPYSDLNARYAFVAVDAYFAYYPCSIGATCAATMTRGTYQTLSQTYSGTGPSLPSSLTFTLTGARGVPGAGYIVIQTGVQARVDVSGASTATSEAQATVSSITVP